jgi:peptide/nickel transport system permease protein
MARKIFQILRGLGSFLVTAILTMAGLIVVTFVVARLLPSDPVLAMVGDRASEELYWKVYQQMGLDKPLPVQLLNFSLDMFQGRFGSSLVTGNEISQDIKRYFPATLELATTAVCLGLLAGILISVAAAVRPDGAVDHLGRLLSLLGHCLPVFWLGLLALLVFYVKLGWVEGPGRISISFAYSVPKVTGLVILDSLWAGNWAALKNAIGHFILPAGLLGLVATSYLARMTRAFLFSQMSLQYVRVLKLKGLGPWRIVLCHALPNCFGGIMSVTAMTYAYLLEGSVLTETVFAWPGLGTYITNSLFAADVKAVLASTMVVGLVYVTLNMLSERLQNLFDARSAV